MNHTTGKPQMFKLAGEIENMKTAKLIIILFSLLLLDTYKVYAHGWMAPESDAKKENPIKINEKSINNGKKLFENFCSSCHGPEATGIKKEITGLNIDTPNLPARLKTHTDGDFHWKILNGRNQMPSFKEELSENEIWHIINYIRVLIKK